MKSLTKAAQAISACRMKCGQSSQNTTSNKNVYRMYKRWVAIDACAVLSKKNQNRISYSGHALNQLIFSGGNDCNLLLHLTTIHVYEHFGEAIARLPPPRWGPAVKSISSNTWNIKISFVKVKCFVKVKLLMWGSVRVLSHFFICITWHYPPSHIRA